MNIFEKLRAGAITRSPEASMRLAGEVAGKLPEEAVLALDGDLGAGKTTFVKGLAARWGIKEMVTSPTFTICNLYQGERQLAHMDAYRLQRSPGIWEELMLEELIRAPFCLAIEWPNNLCEIPWPITHRLAFLARGDERIIRLA